ncbi:hypothetical protein [Nocardia asiatica]|uniref:hypothetical protein n=1 Tax=Nocardia asiatica TaxID=209252 RepID=UPI0002F06F44|nr:hypothetical protein [Nocardia asiatica]
MPWTVIAADPALGKVEEGGLFRRLGGDGHRDLLRGEGSVWGGNAGPVDGST